MRDRGREGEKEREREERERESNIFIISMDFIFSEHPSLPHWFADCLIDFFYIVMTTIIPFV